MTPLTRVLRWLRGPWVAPDPAPDLSRLDRADGLDTRMDYLVGPLGRMTAPCPVCGAPDHVGWMGSLPTRYDLEWPDVLAAEAPGGDLAAMAAPLPGMARDDLGTYAEPVGAERVTWLDAAESVTRFRAAFAAKPHGRHRQTDPADLILADLRDLGGQ